MQLPALAVQQPDFGRSLATIASLKASNLQNKLLEAKMAREEQVQGLMGQAMGGGTEGAVAGEGAPSAPTGEGGEAARLANTPAMRKLVAIAPDKAKAILDFASTADKAQIEQARRGAEGMAKLALPILQAPPEQRPLLYAQTIGKMQASGQQLKNPPPAQYDEQWLNARVMEALSIDQVLSEKSKAADAQKPMTGIGKLESDRRKGLITQDQYQTGIDIEKKPLVQMGEKLTPGQKKSDEKAADTYNSWVVEGAYGDYQKNIDQLRSVKEQLAKETGLTGPLVGMIPREARSVTHPKAMAAQEAVEEVVQRNLRIVLGAQFTEKEGERLIARSYNPLLSQEENAGRLDRLISSMEKAGEAKNAAMKYFEEHGSMVGYKGATNITIDTIAKDAKLDRETKADKDASADILSQAKDAIAKGAPKDKVIERLKKSGVSVPKDF
jgi:hypothetical protein